MSSQQDDAALKAFLGPATCAGSASTGQQAPIAPLAKTPSMPTPLQTPGPPPLPGPPSAPFTGATSPAQTAARQPLTPQATPLPAVQSATASPSPLPLPASGQASPLPAPAFGQASPLLPLSPPTTQPPLPSAPAALPQAVTNPQPLAASSQLPLQGVRATAPPPATAAQGAKADDGVIASILGQAQRTAPLPSALAQSPDTMHRAKDDAVVAGLMYSAPARAFADDAVITGLLAGGDAASRDNSALPAVLAFSPLQTSPAAVPSRARTGTERDDALLDKLLKKSRETPKAKRDDDIIQAVLQQSSHMDDDAALVNMLRTGGGGRQQQLKDDAALASFLGAHDRREGRDDQALAKVMRDGEAVKQARHLPRSWWGDLSNWLCHVVPVEVIAGGRGRGSQLNQLSFPCGVSEAQADDSPGSVLVADSGNRRVMRWQPLSLEGEVLAGRWKSEPFRVISDGFGGLLVSVGAVVEHWSLGAMNGRVVASGSWPTGMARAKHGALIVADTLDHCVCVVWLRPGHKTKPERLAGGGGFSSGLAALHRPFDVVLERNGNVLVLDSANHRVVRWVLSVHKREARWRPSCVVAGGHGPGSHAGQLNFPRGLAVDDAGAVLVADTFNHRVLRFAPGSSHGEVVAGGRGCGARLDQLNHPCGIALDKHGSLLIADTGNHRVLRYPKVPSESQ